MRYFSGVVFSLMVILLTVGCAKQNFPSTQVERKDSVSVKESFADTTIAVPGDSASASVVVKDSSTLSELHRLLDTPVKKRSIKANATLSMKGNALSADCICDSLQLKLDSALHTIKEFQLHTKDTTITNTVEVKYIPWWVKILAWIGGITSLFGIIYGSIKIGKA